MAHRPLTETEIRQLEAQGCSAQDWSQVLVKGPFQAERVVGAHFSGNVRLGRLNGAVSLPGRPDRRCGVYWSRVHECTIGDHCVVDQVGLMAHYELEVHVAVEQVAVLQVTGETSFGNGVEIDVLNEGGGRGLPICDRLSAQLAYLIVCYRHDAALVARLTELVRAYARSRRAPTGRIGEGAQLSRVSYISNVEIGPFAQLEGAARLEEGTIASCREAPTRVGTGVQARRFIFLSGAQVDQGAIVDRCLVGQNVSMGRQYSAENSVFFCNSELFHGEACSVFAGPYTVTHHKSTLLIAGLFSFYNAGSGTNQSNHMYKLGPVHQGVLERGCKTGSFSYLLWPSRVGAFSSVIGKHATHFDSSNLPFAVISEHAGRSVCIPGMNLFTVGTRRDGAKWPARDGRTDPARLDQVHFPVLSPYTIGRMLRGIEQLNALAGKAREGQDFLNFNGIAVQKLLVKTSARYYEIAIRLFIGECLARKLESLGQAATLAERRAGLAADVAPELYPWVDLGGLLAPQPVVAALLARVTSGALADLDAFLRACRAIHRDYEKHEWSWCARLIAQRTGQDLATIPTAALIQLLEQWRETVGKFHNMVVQDAAREFDADMQLGYGIDGDAAVRAADFEAVRGAHVSNKFVLGVREDTERTNARAQQLIDRLSALVPADVPLVGTQA
ncbi:MAG: DUF4954 family protein [Gemmatimonadetes bacterium]|nr:DUF4954 family protein [Gemmatimonadota bacterium]